MLMILRAMLRVTSIVHITLSPGPSIPSAPYSCVASLGLRDERAAFFALERPLLQTQTTTRTKSAKAREQEGKWRGAYKNTPELYEIIEESRPGPEKS
jgi:hypothetical protein